ncbi:hypothetical protein AMTRI_Chr11g153480 [Amborella trichopoda]|nr:ABC transporter B family member 29, chloroplastic isoform X1 [Amborella trichopoda]XP_020529634.1 ABC transporter B family member 29, chloroplastic isoform X1 [Amborella trichopoda]|eukprot:XP_020529633.1 ABC transporter B family member 29, chloroplastic isoform X1 [Amborella trichopoda]
MNTSLSLHSPKPTLLSLSSLYHPKFRHPHYKTPSLSPAFSQRNPTFKCHDTHSSTSNSPLSNPFSQSFFVQNPLKIPFPLSSFDPIKPFLLSQHQPILKGWIFSVISVLALSRIVPMVGKFSTMMPLMKLGSLVREGSAIAALVLIRLMANYWQQAFLWEAALNASYEIRVDVFERVLQRELGFFEGTSGAFSGDISYRITAEASDIADTIYALIYTIVPYTLQLFAMSFQMVAISPVLYLITSLVIPCMCLVIAYLGEKLRKISKKAHHTVAKLSSYLNEVLPSMIVVKAYNAETCESLRFQKLAHDDLSQHLRKKTMKAFIPQVIQVIYVGIIFVFCVGSLVVSGGAFDGSHIVSFITSVFLLIAPVQGVGKAYNELKQGEPAIERLFNLTSLQSQVFEKPDAITLNNVKGDVKFCDVSFQYGDKVTPVLNGLNLHIKPGETIALIGPSGGGKTTIAKLLLRFYDPICGQILIDNQDIQDIRLESLRRHVALVPQDIMLFSGTVAENIGYRDLMGEINMEEVEHAARVANADEFIKKLTQGYQTNIGPRGSILSGGQKQRLAIARTIYQNSSILILDEATSALDSRSELLVRQAVKRLMDNHTVLIIAHRLETILMADRIVSLDGGKLKEVSHSSLLNHGNHYAPLM